MYDSYWRPCPHPWFRKRPGGKKHGAWDLVYWCLLALALLLGCVLICIVPDWLIVAALLVTAAIFAIKFLKKAG